MTTAINQKKSSDMISISSAPLREIQQLFQEVEENDNSAVEFLTKPLTFLSKRGYYLPSKVRMSVTPTEVVFAQLITPQGVNDYIDHQQSAEGKIKIHVKNGIAKCVRIEFECPKKTKPSNDTGSARDLASSMTLAEFGGLINEAEANDKAADELLASPRRYFEKRGFIASPDIRFVLTPSEDRRKELLQGGELFAAKLLDEQPAASQEIHIKKGKGACTILTIECPK